MTDRDDEALLIWNTAWHAWDTDPTFDGQAAAAVIRAALDKKLEEASRVPELDLAGEHAVTISDAIRALKGGKHGAD